MKNRTLFYRTLTALTLLALLLPLSPSSSLSAQQGNQHTPVAPEVSVPLDEPTTANPMDSAADTVSPSPITNLVAETGASPGTVELSWVAPGDDATAGTASTYVVRYNTTVITETTWAASTDVSGEPAPSPAGTVESMTVTGLTPGQRYHFAIKTEDEASNTSSISNSPRATAQTSPNSVYLPLVASSFSGDVPTVIPETTEVLTETTTEHLTEMSADRTVFTFTQSTSSLNALETGDVMVGDATTNAPNGFLRKVTAVSSSGGQVVVETEQATLDEAIESGEAHISQKLTPDQIQSSVQVEGVALATASWAQSNLYFEYTLEEVVLYDHDGDPDTEDDQITANGSVQLEPGFDFNLKVRRWELKELSFTTSAEETAEIEVGSEIALADVKKEKEIARHTFSPITVMVGPVPVVLVPMLTVNVGVDGSVHVGITTSVTQQATMNAGLEYAGGTWSPISDFSNEFNYNPPALSAGLDMKGYAGAQISLKLYGVTGPYAELNAYLKLEANTNAEPWWKLYGGLEMPAGVEIEVMSHLVASYDTTVIDYRLPLAQAQTNTPPNLPADPSPVSGATDQSRNVALTWSGGDLDGDTVTYDIYLEAGDATPDIVVSDDQSGLAYDPGTLSSNTHYYWRIVAQDEHGATNAGPVWDFTTGTATTCPITIPAGEFQMGCDDTNPNENCYSEEQPLHNVYLDAYAIDKYEVTNAQYAEFLNAEGNQEEGGNTWLDADDSDVRIHESGGVWQADAGYEDHPVVEVTWYGARAYCEWQGKRLPTEAEWEKAARGASDTRMYPWGNEDPDCSRLNYYDSTEGRCVGDTAPVGSYPSGASPYGALDMAGNVWEWVNDWYDSDYYDVSPHNNPPGPDSGYVRVLRGGSWPYDWYTVRVAYRSYDNPSYSRDTIGFRCAGAAPGQ
jgi:formylglycine-generating enzyme required for sulfatase activity